MQVQTGTAKPGEKLGLPRGAAWRSNGALDSYRGRPCASATRFHRLKVDDGSVWSAQIRAVRRKNGGVGSDDLSGRYPLVPPSLPGARLLGMNARVDHILNEALALAAEERSALVVALLESLETSADPKISDAWREEIHRRRIALRAGATQPVPWSDARARLHSL
jgi:putative addiction module component (TIGR02574 family)